MNDNSLHITLFIKFRIMLKDSKLKQQYLKF